MDADAIKVGDRVHWRSHWSDDESDATVVEVRPTDGERPLLYPWKLRLDSTGETMDARVDEVLPLGMGHPSEELDPVGQEREAIALELESRAKAYDEEGGGGALAAYALRDAARWTRGARDTREERRRR